jgi:hypothetical protein
MDEIMKNPLLLVAVTTGITVLTQSVVGGAIRNWMSAGKINAKVDKCWDKLTMLRKFTEEKVGAELPDREWTESSLNKEGQ